MERLIKMLKNNIKLCLIQSVIILLGTLGVTYSLMISNFREIAFNTTTVDIGASINSSSGTLLTSNGNMLPISDDLVNINVADTRVLKAEFSVSGVDGNPANTIYDISLRDIVIDCALRTEELKWRLYKNGSLIYSGNLSPAFDTMANNRLVLTETQQSLSTTVDNYVFLLWISESCSSDSTDCDSSLEQSKYLNKNFSAGIKVELSTKSVKNLQRITSTEDSCKYVSVSVPVCNSLTYTGNSQTLVNSGTGYTLINSVGTNIGRYVVTAKLNEGYKWTDGSTEKKLIYCEISS